MRGTTRLAVGCLGVISLWLAVLAPDAIAAVDGPIAGLDRPGKPAQQPRSRSALDTSQNLIDHSGQVVHSNTVRLIFWNPSNYSFTWDPGYKELMGRFVQDVAADAGKQTNPYSLTPQYANGTGAAPYNTVYGGAFDDSDPAPATSDCAAPAGWSLCLKSMDLSMELRSFINAQNVMHPASFPTGMGQIYMLVTPQGFASCENNGTTCQFNGYCAFHSASTTGSFGDSSTILWADIPYTAGVCRATWPRPNGNAADTVISSISHEHIEILTDPLPGANPGWQDSAGLEIGDKCASFQGHYLNGSTGSTAYDTMINGHPYDIQGEWSNADASCQMSEGPVAGFAVPSPASGRVTGSPIAFDATASNDLDGSVASYSWSFGDGSTGTGATPSHTYAAEGTYSITLTVTDSQGNTDATTSQLVIDEAPMASLTRSPAGVIRPGQAVTFDGTTSSDPDGSIPLHTWDFGDGASAPNGRTATHAYSHDGTYTVTMTAYDSEGHHATTVDQVTVDEAPTIRLSVLTGHRVVGKHVRFRAIGQDPDGAIASYVWRFGDGKRGSGRTPKHVYKAAGNYTVTVIATDRTGQSVRLTKRVHIAQVPGR